MTRIIHLVNHVPIHAKNDDPHFLLTNQNGDYLLLGNPNNSNYGGYFVRDAEHYIKILANIVSSNSLDALEIDERKATRSAGTSMQEFFLLEHGLLMNGKGTFTLTLDCKRLYDESDVGRMYAVDHQEVFDAQPISYNNRKVNIIDITYTKHGDNALSRIAYVVHVSIATTMSMKLLLQWRKCDYSYDARRGTANTPWVFDAIQLDDEGAVAIAVGKSPAYAQQRALDILLSRQHTVRKHTTTTLGDLPTMPANSMLAWRALTLLQRKTGIMAGLPWFFQEWSRDELIALGGFLEAKKYTAIIGILDKWYSVIRNDGTLPAIYPDQGLSSADAPGWLGKRTRDLLKQLSEENALQQLPKETIIRWRDATGHILDSSKQRIRDGLLWNDKNTTWMDTSYDDDGRAGARIEIQALFLALFDAHAHLCTLTKTVVEKERSALATAMINSIHSRLVIGEQLLDGIHADGSPDITVRPNIFLAWYAAPKLFTAKEWTQFFHHALPQLWLPWGGLSSIAVTDHQFHDSYTGENVASYHRGDSWYYVNNIAAIAMRSVDPEAFKAAIAHITAASMRDLVEQGIVGCCSELSSAGHQEAAGCHAQAWSASTLLELLQQENKSLKTLR